MSLKVRFRGRDHDIESGETVLDCLLRHGHPMPHACLMGACETCVLKVVSGTVAEEFTDGLDDDQVEEGLFYACLCVPEVDLEVETPD